MTMTMNDHSSQLPVNKALTCPEGQSAGAVASPWLAKEIRSVQKDEVVRSLRSVKEFRSDLLPLGIKRSCIGVGKEMCCFQYEYVRLPDRRLDNETRSQWSPYTHVQRP